MEVWCFVSKLVRTWVILRTREYACLGMFTTSKTWLFAGGSTTLGAF
ncbi:MAG: hypothetical protein RIQ78_375 [Bacteroidota bacterium]|jgi:hypothetical protein